MYAPINGSQNNPRAKLYKHFTSSNPQFTGETIKIELEGEEVIVNRDDVVTYQKNTYVCHHTFPWVEATGCGEEDYQPIKGLITHTASMTIKMNAPYFKRLNDVKIPDHGDLVKLHDELWIIEDGIQRERHKTLKNLATYYLPLKRLM